MPEIVVTCAEEGGEYIFGPNESHPIRIMSDGLVWDDFVSRDGPRERLSTSELERITAVARERTQMIKLKETGEVLSILPRKHDYDVVYSPKLQKTVLLNKLGTNFETVERTGEQ